MTIDLTEDFEGASSGTAISTSNTGFDSVNGTALTFDSAEFMHGSLSMKCTATGALATGVEDYTLRSTTYSRFYLKINALPAAQVFLGQIQSTSTTRAQLRLNTDGTLTLRNGTVAVFTSTSALSTGTWYRIEWLVLNGTGQTVRLYAGDSATAIEDSGNQTYNSGTHNRMALGCVTGVTFTGWFDDFEIRDDTWPGPSVTSTPLNSDLDLRWAVKNSVSSDSDIRWIVRSLLNSDSDFRWITRNAVSSDVDLRWLSYNRLTSDTDLRWTVRSILSSDVDLRWISKAQVLSDLDLRWVTNSSVLSLSSDVDLRWAVRAVILSSVDLRWITRNALASDLSLPFAVRSVALSDADLRWGVHSVLAADLSMLWRVRGLTLADLDVRWPGRGLVLSSIELQWAVYTLFPAATSGVAQSGVPTGPLAQEGSPISVATVIGG